jgi:uncharacterized phage-associated protein
MVSPLDVARYFIFRAYEDGREALMTNMKVQKLLYYTQSLHLALFEEPLFDDEIQAWRYGPVCPPAYRFYREFEEKQLPFPRKNELTQFSEETQNLIEEVWEYFGEHHAYYLSGLTHLEFPWKKARKGLPAEAASQEPILLSDMQELGQQKLEEIERSHSIYEKVVPFLLRETFSENTTKTYVKQGEVHDWLNSLLA